ncbi:MAG: hypothetical protein HQL75_07115 [Magnetococcales bacterium]|nr:hypothetical protein [Magnetococcales bacterium]
MDVAKAIQNITAGIKGVNQKRVALEAGVNQGQLSHWLRNGVDFSEENISKVIKTVLFIVDEENKKSGNFDYYEKYGEELSVLNSSPIFQKLLLEVMDIAPDQPIPANNPALMAQPGHALMTKEIGQNPPIRIAIIGGRKTGRSSALLKAKADLARKNYHSVIFDGRLFAAEYDGDDEPLFRWLDTTARSQLPGRQYKITLRKISDFEPWVKKNILPNLPGDKQLVFMIDHLDEFPPKAFASLAFGFHDLFDKEDENNPVSLLVSYNEAGGKLFDVNAPASTFARQLRTISLGNTQDAEIVRLLETMESTRDHALEWSEFAWNRFSGHPYLTFNWAHLVARGEKPEKALETMAVLLKERLLLPLLEDLARCNPSQEILTWPSKENVVERIFTGIFGQQENSNLVLRSYMSQWMVDSGLFRWEQQANGQRGIVTITPWISDKIDQILKN